MDKFKILSDIDNQITGLGYVKTFWGYKTLNFSESLTPDRIDSKISSIRRTYYFYLGLSIICAVPLYVAGFAKIFEFNFWDLSKSGVLIVLAVGSIIVSIRYKIALERLKLIKYLLGLKLVIDQE